MSLSHKTIEWLRENCPADLKGKTAVVTGASSGIGLKTAEILLHLGAGVIMACRNTEKAENAAKNLLSEYPDAKISVMRLDLADLSSVDNFIAELAGSGRDIDVFVNNAGTFRSDGRLTKDGFGLVLGTNWIGFYRLSEKLLPYLAELRHRVTVVNTVSIVCGIAREIDYGDFWLSRRYSDLAAYSRSKLCVAKYTLEEARKYSGTEVGIYMIHPGVSITPLTQNAYGKTVGSLAGRFRRLFNSPERSALPLFYILGHRPDRGSLIGPRAFFGFFGFPSVNRIPRKAKTGAVGLAEFTDKEINLAGYR